MTLVRCSLAESRDSAELEALARRVGLEVNAGACSSQSHVRVCIARLNDSAQLVGFIVYWELGDEVEIHDLATAPEHRRRGIASALLSEAIRSARRSGAHSLWLEVRARNQAALGLYTKHGFRTVATRKQYYRSPPDDALCLQLPLGTP